MDIGKTNEAEKRWVAQLRSLARRISSAMPVSVTGRMKMLLVWLFTVGLLGGLRLGESEIWLTPPLFTLVLAVVMLGALNRHGAIALSGSCTRPLGGRSLRAARDSDHRLRVRPSIPRNDPRRIP